MMPFQRARVAESRVRNKSSNGPLRAQSNGFIIHPEYSATCGHTSFARDMLVSCQAHELYREFKVAPRITRSMKILIRPWQKRDFLSGAFFSEQRGTMEFASLHARMQACERTLDCTT